MRRKDLDGKWPYQIEPMLLRGEYAQALDKDLWICRAPNGDLASFSTKTHQITVHDDGEVTMSPSLQFLTGQHWHGYMRRGVMTEQ